MKTFKDHLNIQRHKYPHEFQEFEEDYELFKLEAIGALIKEKRKEKGLTQDQLAVLVSTKKQAISRLERNPSDIKLSTLLKISKALGSPLIRIGE